MQAYPYLKRAEGAVVEGLADIDNVLTLEKH